MVPECKQQYAAGIQDGCNAHGDGIMGNVCFTLKIRGRIETCNPVEADAPRFTVLDGSRLIKSDITGASDFQDLNVDPADEAVWYEIVCE